MGNVNDSITPDVQRWLERQRLFFVATAPLASDGFVNCSPKGMDSFRVLGPRDVAYVDLTGSGIETVAHVQENGRIVFMFCAFDGPPKIVRLHGTGQIIRVGTPAFDELRTHFPEHLGTRAIIRAAIMRVSDSCGYAVPRYDYVADRDSLAKWADKKGRDGLAQYRHDKNARSVDGLRGL